MTVGVELNTSSGERELPCQSHGIQCGPPIRVYHYYYDVNSFGLGNPN